MNTGLNFHWLLQVKLVVQGGKKWEDKFNQSILLPLWKLIGSTDFKKLYAVNIFNITQMLFRCFWKEVNQASLDTDHIWPVSVTALCKVELF